MALFWANPLITPCCHGEMMSKYNIESLDPSSDFLKRPDRSMRDAGVLNNGIEGKQGVLEVGVDLWDMGGGLLAASSEVMAITASVLWGSHLLPSLWVSVKDWAQTPEAAVGPAGPVEQSLGLGCVQRANVVCAVFAAFLTMPESRETRFTRLRQKRKISQ